MNPVNSDPINLTVEVIEEHAPESIWRGSRFEGYRQNSNALARLVDVCATSRQRVPY